MTNAFCLALENIQRQNRYVEWEDDLERKRLAAEILNTKKFTPIPGACNRYLQTF